MCGFPCKNKWISNHAACYICFGFLAANLDTGHLAVDFCQFLWAEVRRTFCILAVLGCRSLKFGKFLTGARSCIFRRQSWLCSGIGNVSGQPQHSTWCALGRGAFEVWIHIDQIEIWKGAASNLSFGFLQVNACPLCRNVVKCSWIKSLIQMFYFDLRFGLAWVFSAVCQFSQGFPGFGHQSQGVWDPPRWDPSRILEPSVWAGMIDLAKPC